MELSTEYRPTNVNAAAARAKLEAIIDRGRASALHTYEHAMTSVIEDSLVRDEALLLDVDGTRVYAAAPGLEAAPLTDHALGQLCARAGMPAKFARELLEHDSPIVRTLAAENLETLMRAGKEPGRMLVRAQGGMVRAVLSDSYKRVDSRPMIDTFVNACSERSLVPIEGQVTDTRIAIKALLPQVFEVNGDVMCFGMQLKTSDYGAGAFVCAVFVLRLWCANGATLETAMRQVHLGRKLDEGTFSQKTYDLDSATSVSALNDVVHKALAPSSVSRYLNVIDVASSSRESFDAAKALDTMQRGGKITKAEQKELVKVYNTPDVEKLPPGNTPWRLSNAISWFAHSPESPHSSNDRRLDLEKLAGDVLAPAS